MIARLALACVVCCACSWGDDTANQPGQGRGLARTPGPDLHDVKRRPSAPKAEQQLPQLGLGESRSDDPSQDEQAQAEHEEEPERNYSAELKAALGSPLACLKPRKASSGPPAKISIQLQATVMAGGNISRAYARSAQLDREERDCVADLLARKRLAEGVADAPRTVHAEFELALKAEGKPP